MPDTPPRWGIVTTVKTPLERVLEFAAYHLDLGAHRIIIYLDDDDAQTFETLNAHPKLRPVLAGPENWRSDNRPEKHQPRQVANARHAYRRKSRDLDWLAHIDVDEFLLPDKDFAEQLQALPQSATCARIRPIEALSKDGVTDIPPGVTCFKAMTNDRRQRQQESEAIYPTYGAQLNGGFLSHVEGKMVFRTRVKGLVPKIHNVKIDRDMNPGQVELTTTRLCHLHAPSWEDWQRAYRYRLEQGVYRSELKPNRSRETGGITMHELFNFIESDGGEAGLRRFFDEVCVATPALRARLEKFGLLHCVALGLEEKRARHFP
ncbi:MAG: hypothetical protein CSA70_01565 [Rhodobacterales bacterium]|nr:MAG: hypothetical protein CSA70_01565 [Rhodobacterales bacterium]